MAGLAMIPIEIVNFKKQFEAKGLNFEEILKKHFNCSDVIITELGGVWIGDPENGRMLNKVELEKLADELKDMLNS